MTTTTQPDRRANGSRDTRRAWWSLVGFVPSFVLAFVVGEGLVAALGYPSGGDTTPPWWAMLIAVTPALLVFVLPAVLCLHFGRRALRQGDDSAKAPMILALVFAGGFLALNGLSGLLVLLSS